MASLISLMSGIAWTRQYFNLDGNPKLIQLLSYVVEDTPWMPSDAPKSIPLIGSHHFGDLTLGLGYGLTQNPYIGDYPAQIPPLGILQFRALAYFGYETALIILTLGTLIPFLLIGWRLLINFEPPLRIILLNLFVVLTMGMVTNFDRGAVYMAIFGLVIISFELIRCKKEFFASILLILIFSMKPHFLILLTIPFFRRQFKFVFSTAIVTIGINLFLFAFFPGNWRESISGYLQATSRYSGQNADFSWVIFDGSGVVGGIYKAIAAFSSPETAAMMGPFLLKYAILISLFFFLTMLPLIISSGLPHWITLSFLFSSTMMIVPGNRYYTLAWASAAAIYFSAESRFNPWPTPITKIKYWHIPKRYLFVARGAIMFMIVGSLTPWVLRINLSNGFESPLAYFIPQWTIIFSMLVCLSILRPKKIDSTFQHRN